ncbi:unnamed protein product [Phyllotreta striolata]|uniref:Uncharacterized protein n=1 Tax=Phyllotreta striolata TaxID=444603 RepID=A0A9N9XJZ1_PHYSR|nr:unnamed protein product [Phyllotreta striolata]
MKLGLLIFLVVVAVLVQDVVSVVPTTESSKHSTTKRKPIKADPAMRYDIFDRRKRDLIEHEQAAAAVGSSYF